jgi:hypothetical protein
MVQNLEKIWKLTILFLIFYWPWAEFLPSWPSLASHPSPTRGPRRGPAAPSHGLHGPTDTLRPCDDEVESELELETPHVKSPLSLLLNGNDLKS